MALTDNILAYWNLNDNGSGGVSLVDSTGNGKTLVNNGTTLGSGIIAGGAVCSGGYLSSPPVDLSANFSHAFWVRFDASVPSGVAIFGAGNTAGYQINIDANDNHFSIVQANLSATLNYNYTFSADQWYFVSVVRTSGVIEVFINDSSIGTNASSLDLTCLDNFQVGGYVGFDGKLDEIGFWNRALSALEVSNLYNGGIGRTYPFTAFYFSGGNLSTLGNWWEDPAFTIPAASLPTSEDAVVISSAVTSGTARYDFATITANIGSAVTITATINLTNAVNSGTLIGATTLNGTASNVGTITGATTLNGTASNAGTITGNATVYYPAQNPLGGSVSGTITYIWTNGTGLWGGDVWIDGSLSFIIPDPSDVKAGVEYGPAEDPYVGTYSGGGGIDLARLIGLPPFIQL
jgi:hypothetical protein